MEKQKLVYITSRFPYPLEKGDKLRAYYQIQELSKVYSITLIAIHDQPVSEEQRKQLNTYCEKVLVYRLPRWKSLISTLFGLLGDKPMQVSYFFNRFIYNQINKELKSIQPDHIFCQLVRVAEYCKNYHNCPKTIDYMDALSKGMERRIQTEKGYMRWLVKPEWKRLVNYERYIFDYFEYHTIISEVDKKFIHHADQHKIIVVPNGISASFFKPVEIDTNYELVFVGNMSYAPNVDCVQFLAQNVLNKRPEWKLLVAGAEPHPKILDLAKVNRQITLTGWIEDIREAYASGKVMCAPLQIGTGMQNKILEAMAQGTPVVTTTLVNQAIGAKNKEEILVCDSVDEIISACEMLINDTDFSKKMSDKAQAFVRERYTWPSSIQPWLTALDENQK